MNKLYYFLSLFMVVSFFSCVDLETDEPPACCPDIELEANATIADLKALYSNGAPVEIKEDWIIKAVVAADDEGGNFYKGVVIQDENDAIELRIDQNNLYGLLPIGRQVFIKAKGLLVGAFNGNLQLAHNLSDNKLQGIPAELVDNFVVRGTSNNVVKIYDATINSLTPDLYFQPVRLSGVEFVSASGTYADADNNKRGFLDLRDCDDNIVTVVTSGYADFAGNEVAKGNGEFVAIFTVYNGTKQLVIRNLDDVKMEGERCNGGGTGGDKCAGVPLGDAVNSINVDFNDQEDKKDIAITGWSNIKCEGDRLWQAKEFDGNVYASVSSYKAEGDNNVVYLMTPKLNITSSSKLSFRSAVAYHKHDGLKVLISNDYDGSDVNSATWTELSANLAGSSNANYEWVESGNVDLSSFSGTAVIAFQYTGNKSSKTTTAIVDDVKITE